MKILVLANHYNTLRIFRRELLQALSAAGHDVVISIPPCDEENRKILESYGTRVIFTAFERRGKNPLADLKLLEEYKRLIKAENPDKVITYTIKCNIYGATACKKYKVPCYVNVTGLGSTFQGHGLMRKLVSAMYKISLNKAAKVFFENEGNRDTLVNDGIVRAEQTVVMPGAGVNLTEFAPVPYPDNDDIMRFLFVGRIMREKGVDEYFSAIKRIRKEYPNTEFDFIGWYEDNYEAQVKQLEAEEYIRFHGFQADVKLGQLEKKNRTLQEKMADIRTVNRAKWLLIENLGMTEKDAHYYIEKQAMDTRMSRREVAVGIIRTYDK